MRTNRDLAGALPTTKAITAMTALSMPNRFPMVPSSPAIRVMALAAVLHRTKCPVVTLTG
jgi:hypothetical protein